MFVGLYVPEAIWLSSGNDTVAVSSKVSVTLLASLPPPASDMSSTVWPAGPTNNTSTSSGKVWLNPRSVTVTFETGAVTPDTEMVDGNGDALPLFPVAGIEMKVEFVRLVLARIALP